METAWNLQPAKIFIDNVSLDPDDIYKLRRQELRK